MPTAMLLVGPVCSSGRQAGGKQKGGVVTSLEKRKVSWYFGKAGKYGYVGRICGGEREREADPTPGLPPACAPLSFLPGLFG